MAVRLDHPHAHRHPLVRQFRARPRLILSCLIGVAVALLLPSSMIQQPITRWIIGWNAGAGLYLGLAVRMMFGSNHEKMRLRARMQDEGRVVVLMLVVLATFTTLAAIVVELAMVKDLQGFQRYSHLTLTVLTILSSWAFTHLMFALHYAHDYYTAQLRGLPAGLQFPGTDQPDYGDFLYFSYIIGTSAQTADVTFSTSEMRRTGYLHCILAFFFNTTLLALTINIASGLF